MDIFLAGYNTISGNEGVWVVSMKHLMGLFGNPWIGVKETKKLPCYVTVNLVKYKMVKLLM